MAINIPILTEFSDSGIKAAKAAFGNFKTAVADAQGGMGKFKAGSKVALDAVAANAGMFAIAGGAAIAKFAFDGVADFAKLALAAGKFANATGLAVEDASRYMEAAKDIDVPVEALETAIGKLNKTIGADPDKVRDLGVDLVYLKDGSIDVNETFLNTIERLKGITDPAERATVASQLLGKGWQSMAELINMGSGKLETSLRSVSDAQVISPEELQKAIEYREAMDELGDSVQELKLAAGQNLIPALSKGATALATAINAFDSEDPLKFAKDALVVYNEEVNQAREDSENFKQTIRDFKRPMKNLADATEEVTVALIDADKAWNILTGNLDREVALDNAKQQLKDLEDAAKRAFGSGAQADIDAYDQAAADFVGSLAAISDGMDGISSKEILIRYKTQGPAAALELANYLARGAEYGGLSAEDALTLAGISTLPARANGGPVMSGTTYLVGERGPELFTPSSSGNITPNHAMGGGGNTITVNVNGGDPDAVVRAIQQWSRDNGAVPIRTTMTRTG
jgi:hypothetical protein